MIKIHTLMLGSYQTNCYIVWGEGETWCVVIDPGDCPEQILQATEEAGVKIAIENMWRNHQYNGHIVSSVCSSPYELRDYVDSKFEKVEGKLCEQMAYNAANNATIGCISAQVQQLFGLTKLVVPNTSVCPGWGEVKVNIVPETTTAAG